MLMCMCVYCMHAFTEAQNHTHKHNKKMSFMTETKSFLPGTQNPRTNPESAHEGAGIPHAQIPHEKEKYPRI
jgi:hypothetical protein